MWDNEILDRPTVAVHCGKDKKDPYRDVRPWKNETLKDYYLNVHRQKYLDRSGDRRVRRV